MGKEEEEKVEEKPLVEFIPNAPPSKDEEKGAKNDPAAQKLQQKLHSQRQPDDPIPEKRKPPARKREKNPLFQDLEKTGRWGAISKKEMGIVAVVALMVIGGIIAIIVVFATKDSGPVPAPPRTPAPTPAPTPGPDIAPETQLPVILAAVQNNSFVDSSLLVDDVAFYNGKADDASQPAMVRAISWSLYDDPLDPPPDSRWLVPRFALATFYYGMQGDTWTNKTNWLGGSSACDWHGIFCDRFAASLQELALIANDVQGSIQPEISLLSDLSVLTLPKNKLTGPLPAEAVGSMPRLSFLVLYDNELTGTISPDLANSVLCKFNLACLVFRIELREVAHHVSTQPHYSSTKTTSLANGHFAIGVQVGSTTPSTSCPSLAWIATR
jgi:hypothetical protein